ncbi:FAD/NAD(P)-binding protein [Streptomyces sp. NPDC058676]|uniref:FAD/NAD(P)-binding protein n=1 Tax=unclassified Streptomyces TaxID=2593676 RepID=UPI00364894C6
MTKRIVIIGGGATAVSALAHLAGAPGNERITLVAPGAIGFGTAFGTTDPTLLCNTSVDVTSLLAEGRSDFLDYLAARGHPVHHDDFVPRYLVGQYCRERYGQYRDRARAMGTKVTHIRERAVAINSLDDGTYQVELADGATVEGTDVIFCAGADAPRLPAEVSAHQGDPCLIESPYPADRLRRLPHDARVLVLGSKLSAIDAALVLSQQGRRYCVLTSPSATLPAVRTRLRRSAEPAIGPSDWAALDPEKASFDGSLARMLVRAIRRSHPEARGVRTRSGADMATRLLREEAQLADEGRIPWQDIVAEVIDALNEHVPHWRPQAATDVLARYRTLMSRYISAIPLHNAKLLGSHAAAGRLRVAPDYLERIKRTDVGWQVDWPDGSRESFDQVVVAAGYRTRRLTGTVGRLHIGYDGDGPEPELLADLRVRFPDRGTPERIWVLGAAAGARHPIVNYLRAAAQHAAVAGDQIARPRTDEVATFAERTAL